MSSTPGTPRIQSQFGDIISRSGDAGARLITAKAQADLAASNPEAYVKLAKTELIFGVIVLLIFVYMASRSGF